MKHKTAVSVYFWSNQVFLKGKLVIKALAVHRALNLDLKEKGLFLSVIIRTRSMEVDTLPL